MTDKWIGVGQASNNKEVYHTDKHCRFGPDEMREVSQSELEYHDMRVCRYCKDRNTGMGGKTGTKLATKIKQQVAENND